MLQWYNYYSNVISRTTISSVITSLPVVAPFVTVSTSEVVLCLCNTTLPAHLQQSHWRHLIKPKVKRHSVTPKRCVSLATWNARSINNKVEEVKQLFDDHGLHILALTETWHESYDAFTIKRLSNMGFSIIEEARSANKPHDSDRWRSWRGCGNSEAWLPSNDVRHWRNFQNFEWIGCRVSSSDMSFTLLTI